MTRNLRLALAGLALVALATMLLLKSDDPRGLPGVYTIDWDASEARIDRGHGLRLAKMRTGRAIAEESGLDEFELELMPDHRYELRVPGPRRDEVKTRTGTWERAADRVTLHEDAAESGESAEDLSLVIERGDLVIVGEMREDVDLVLSRR